MFSVGSIIRQNFVSRWNKILHLLCEMDSVPSVNLDMLNISHAKKAQDLATDTKYKTFLHEYTTLPTDMNVSWAKKAYGLQSDVGLIVRLQVTTCLIQQKNLLIKGESDACPPVETVQVRSELDEGRRLGGLKVSGCPAGKEGRGARQ